MNIVLYLLRRPVSAGIHTVCRSLLTQYIMNVVYLPQTCSKKSTDRQTDVIFCQNVYSIWGTRGGGVVKRVVSINRSNNSQNTKGSNNYLTNLVGICWARKMDSNNDPSGFDLV